MHCGDISKSVVLVLTIIFFLMLLAHELGHLDVFAKSYQEEGFCVTGLGGDTNPALQGHAVSFYACITMSAAMFALVMQGRLSDEALRPIKKNALSLSGHSLGHAFLASRAGSAGSGSSLAFEELSPSERVAAFLALSLVWWGFKRDPKHPLSAVILALGHNFLQVFVLPTRYFFVHVLLAVLGTSAIRGLSREEHEKDRYYALEATLVDVPILVMTFTEALCCDTWFKQVGGHVWFDMVVPFGFFVYYAILISDPSERVTPEEGTTSCRPRPCGGERRPCGGGLYEKED